jgi:hypothetical protein
MTIKATQSLDFTNVPRADGRSPEIPESADAYGWLVGSWELDCLCYDGVPVSIKGEAHFGWALEGRAVQDVWISQASVSGIAARTGPTTCTAPHYGCGTPPYKPGGFPGKIRSTITMKIRLAAVAAPMLSRSASRRWNADSVDFYRDYTGFFPLARRSTAT